MKTAIKGVGLIRLPGRTGGECTFVSDLAFGKSLKSQVDDLRIFNFAFSESSTSLAELGLYQKRHSLNYVYRG